MCPNWLIIKGLLIDEALCFLSSLSIIAVEVVGSVGNLRELWFSIDSIASNNQSLPTDSEKEPKI